MRNYIYICDECGQTRRRVHSMKDADYYGRITLCTNGHKMRRSIQPVFVNWGQIAPSKGEIGPAVRHLIDPGTQERLREQYAAKKAARGEEWKPA